MKLSLACETHECRAAIRLLARLTLPDPSRNLFLCTNCAETWQTLATLHAIGVFHGDVQSTNILIDPADKGATLISTCRSLRLPIPKRADGKYLEEEPYLQDVRQLGMLCLSEAQHSFHPCVSRLTEQNEHTESQVVSLTCTSLPWGLSPPSMHDSIYLLLDEEDDNVSHAQTVQKDEGVRSRARHLSSKGF